MNKNLQQEHSTINSEMSQSSERTVLLDESQLVPVVPEGGNTITPSVRQISPAKQWCFTFNNYDETDIVPMCQKFQASAKKWLFSREIGESGTPHLQGCVEFSKKLRPLSLGLPRQIHWEKSKGTWDQNVTYCLKDGGEKWLGGFKPKRPLKKLPCEVQLYPWQQSLMNLLAGEPDDRDIFWIWESTGRTGKTTFLKWLMRFHEAIPLEGKKNDILHCAAEHESELYVYDMERSLEQFVSYASIEKIKNGSYMSGKYEGAVVDRNPPHLVIFANFPPEMSKLSLDRWQVYEIESLELVPWVQMEPLFNH